MKFKIGDKIKVLSCKKFSEETGIKNDVKQEILENLIGTIINYGNAKNTYYIDFQDYIFHLHHYRFKKNNSNCLKLNDNLFQL